MSKFLNAPTLSECQTSTTICEEIFNLSSVWGREGFAPNFIYVADDFYLQLIKEMEMNRYYTNNYLKERGFCDIRLSTMFGEITFIRSADIPSGKMYVCNARQDYATYLSEKYLLGVDNEDTSDRRPTSENYSFGFES
jgi:hypothetical protein